MGGTTSCPTGLPSMSITMMSSAVSLLLTDLPELMSMCGVPGRRALMWPLKSMTSARSNIVSASASCCLSSSAAAGVSMAVVVMVMAGAVLVVMAVVLALGARARAARILAEHEGLDRDGHRVRRHSHATQVHVVEVPERDAVDHED